MATARLRKTFQYPTDNSDEDDTREDLDEEEQEKLIKRLREEDDERNEEYKRIFLAIPTISATSYIPALIISRLLQVKLISILSMASLMATAYILVFVPNTTSPSSKKARSHHQFAPEPGPVHQYIDYLNGGLSLLIALNAASFKDKGGVHEGFWLLCFLPLISFTVIMLARCLMLSVDVDELEDLKYGYKGA